MRVLPSVERPRGWRNPCCLNDAMRRRSAWSPAVKPTLLVASTVASIVAGCGGGGFAPDGGPGFGNPDGTVDTEPRPPGEQQGRIRVLEELVFSPNGSSAAGRIDAWFSATGNPSWQHVTMEDGSCALKTFDYEPCDPSCTGICGGPGQCDPWPMFVSAGTLTIAGLGTEVSIWYTGGW
jgi:hypothetical protein